MSSDFWVLGVLEPIGFGTEYDDPPPQPPGPVTDPLEFDDPVFQIGGLGGGVTLVAEALTWVWQVIIQPLLVAERV
jgi:hypothetical protein